MISDTQIIRAYREVVERLTKAANTDDGVLRVGRAMHAIEWHDSGDWGVDQCMDDLRAVMQPPAVLPPNLERAEAAARELLAAISHARGGRS